MLLVMSKSVVATPLTRRGMGPRQRFIILLPDRMANQVRLLAAQGRRPLNTQVEILIEQALRQENDQAVA